MADLRIQCPCRMVISGMTMVGKTHFLVQLLKAGENCFTEKFSTIFWCTGILRKDEMNALEAQFSDIRFIEGFPEEKLMNGTLIPKNKNACLVIGKLQFNIMLTSYFNAVCVVDDLGHVLERSNGLKYVFSMLSHHDKVNVFLLLQVRNVLSNK